MTAPLKGFISHSSRDKPALESAWVEAEVSSLTWSCIQGQKVLIPVRVSDAVDVPPLLQPLSWLPLHDHGGIAAALSSRRTSMVVEVVIEAEDAELMRLPFKALGRGKRRGIPTAAAWRFVNAWRRANRSGPTTSWIWWCRW